MDQPSNTSPSCFGMCNDGGAGTNNNNTGMTMISHHHQHNNQIDDGNMTLHDQQTTREIDTMLSQALNNLTFEERQEQQDVLHGVDTQVSEDATLTEAGLKELDDQLLKSKKGSVYELAETMDPDYVSARDFRFIFLRTDRYNAKDAAKRMLRFFEIKQKLFGTEKLVKDITLADMDEDDIECIKTGSLQPAGRDLAGRQVMIIFPGLRKFKKLENELRAHYYIATSLFWKSEETQMRGCAMVIYSIGDQFQDRSGGRGKAQCAELQITIPPYKASIHCALDTIHDYMLQNLAIKVIPPKLRARFKLHYGSHVECQYRLSTYGILPCFLPLTTGTNVINLHQHLEWVKSRLVAEQRGSPPPTEPAQPSASSLKITTPSPHDVLCIGTTKSKNQGNQQLLVFVKQYSKSYADARTDDLKREVVAEIVGKIHDSGGRFLKETIIDEGGSNNKCWQEMTDTETRKKVMQAFRNLRRRQEVAKQKGIMTGNLIAGEPLPADVIFGRLIQRNSGSDLLQHLIKQHHEEYESLDRGKKMRLVENIMQGVKDQGGRFLQPSATEAGRWIEIPNEDARERVSKYFRNNRRQTKKKGKSIA